MSASRSKATTLAAICAAAFGVASVTGCGSSTTGRTTSVVAIPSTATCDTLLRTDTHLLLHIQPVVNLVQSLAGPTNAEARASSTVTICMRERTAGRGSTAVRQVIANTAVTCSEWGQSSPSAQARLVNATAGKVNLALRVKGTTAACASQPDNEPVAGVISQIASGYPNPVKIDSRKLPRTLSPHDPDQCDERTQAAPGDGSNAAWVRAGLEDCLAMGY